MKGARKGQPVQWVIRRLESLDFKRIRTARNHAVFRHADGRVILLPLHGTIRQGVLNVVLRQAGPPTDWSYE